jgi:hypothetical protein
MEKDKTMVELIGGLVTVPRLIMCVSGLGVLYVNFMARREGYLFFAVAAFFWSVYDYGLGAKEQALVMIVSLITSVVAYVQWGRKEKKHGQKTK